MSFCFQKELGNALCGPMQDQEGPSRNAQLKDNRSFTDDEASATLHTKPTTFARSRLVSDTKLRGEHLAHQALEGMLACARR